MSAVFFVWYILLGVVTLIWATRHAAISRAARTQIPLTSQSFAGPPEPAPPLSVLVAARDEQDNIETCVTSLLGQDYPAFEVIVINDRSADRTAEILDRLAAENRHALKVVHVQELREGWFGKINAMREGVARASGAWLMFTDADCRQICDHTLAVAMRFALENRIDFLSVLPVLEMGSFWERVIQPVCAAIMALWFNPEKVNNPDSPAAYANGPFMLMSRELYEEIGGHERVKTEVNEDMHMARFTKEAGRHLHVVRNTDLYRMRMYANFRDAWRGWSRNFYGCFGSFRRLLISAAVLCVASLLPWASLLIGAGAWALTASADSPWPLVTGLAALAVVVQNTVLLRFYHIAQIDVRLVPTYIIGAVLALGMLLNAMLKLGGRSTTTWRGTTYRGHPLAEVPADVEQGKQVARH